MPGRIFNLGGYRYGFNGKENDDDVKGTGNQQDYGMRIYDPRIGKFLSVDPLTKTYPWYTPYQFAGNGPIANTDLDGAEPNYFMISAEAGLYGKTTQQIVKGTREGVEASLTNTYNFFKRDAWKAETWKQTGLFLEEIILSSSPHSNIYNPSTPRLDAAVKSLERDVINGNAYTRSKFGGQLITDIATAYVSSKGISALSTAAKVALRTNLARAFYEKFAESNIASKLEAINFAKSVSTKILAKGTEVIQWVGEDGKVGKYFAPVGTDPATLGINLEAKGGGLRTFTLKEDVKVLESAAADYKGNKGGGTQYFSPELKNKVESIKGGN